MITHIKGISKLLTETCELQDQLASSYQTIGPLELIKQNIKSQRSFERHKEFETVINKTGHILITHLILIPLSLFLC